MKWEIEWGENPQIFGFDFAGILEEGIEAGMENLEYLQACGRYCDGCGNWRITHTVDFNESSPTDRGSEYRLMPYEFCDECLSDDPNTNSIPF
jgi:hypothetical protein